MAANNIISLTILETGTAIKLNEGDIIQLVGVNSNADSAVTYVANNRTVKTVVMDETPSAIKALAPSLMDVTVTETGSTLTISASRVEFAVASGSGCKITMDEEGATWNQFVVDESVSAIQTAVNAASAGEFVETTGNQTVAGVKTFTGVLTSSNATASTSTITGGAVFSGGVGIAKELYVSTTTPTSISATGVVTITNATASTTKDTGALIVANGGVGVEGAVNAGTAIAAGTTLTAGTLVLAGAGAVGAPAYSFTGAATQGMYNISGTQLGFAVGGVLTGGFNSSGAFTDAIAEQTATVGVTIDGALIKDGSFTGKQATATATADGLTTGLLTGADQFVSVTSAGANNIVALPLDANCPIGTVIRGWVGANGFELRSDASDLTATLNNVTMGTTNEAAIPVDTFFMAKKVATLTWLLTAETKLGAVLTAIIPDAV